VAKLILTRPRRVVLEDKNDDFGDGHLTITIHVGGERKWPRFWEREPETSYVLPYTYSGRRSPLREIS
jgi:hypothetical protein